MNYIQEDKSRRVLSNIFVGALIFCFAALNNKFPLLFEESGVYIKDGFLRPRVFNNTFLYSFFVAHTSWGRSLWLVIYTQSLVLTIVVNYYFRVFLKCKSNHSVFYFCYIFLVSFLMSASVVVSTISPMLFNGISILAFGLLLSVRKMSIKDRLIISTIAVISTAMSISSLLILVIISLLYFIINIIFRKKTLKKNGASIINIGIVTLFCLAIVFLIQVVPKNRLSNDLIPIKSTMLSEKKHEAPAGAKNIITDILGYLNAGVPQPLSPIWDLSISTYNIPIVNGQALNAIEDWFSGDIRECYLSKQREGIEKFTILRISQWLLLLSSIVLYVYFTMDRKMRYRNLLFYFLAAFLLNLAIGSVFNGAQKNNLWSFVWVLPLPLFLIFFSGKTKLKFI